MFGFFKKKKNGEEAKPTPNQQKQRSVGDSYETYEEYEEYEEYNDGVVIPPQNPHERVSVSQYKFSLNIGATDKIIYDPTEEDIKTAVRSMRNAIEDGFVILSCEPGMEGVFYIQAAEYDANTREVYAEVSISPESGREEDAQNYGMRIPITEFEEILKDFINGLIPNIDSWMLSC